MAPHTNLDRNCASLTIQLSQILSSILLLIIAASVSRGLLFCGLGGAQDTTVPLAEALGIKGPANAPVTIVVFSDFQCPYCARTSQILDSLLGSYKKQLRLVFKHNPSPSHGYAPLAHEAAIAAGIQGKFWEMHDLIFANQKTLKKTDLIFRFSSRSSTKSSRV